MKTTKIELDHVNIKVYFFTQGMSRNYSDVVKIEHIDNLMVIYTGDGKTKLLNFNNVNSVEEVPEGKGTDYYARRDQ